MVQWWGCGFINYNNNQLVNIYGVAIFQIRWLELKENNEEDGAVRES